MFVAITVPFFIITSFVAWRPCILPLAFTTPPLIVMLPSSPLKAYIPYLPPETVTVPLSTVTVFATMLLLAPVAFSVPLPWKVRFPSTSMARVPLAVDVFATLLVPVVYMTRSSSACIAAFLYPSPR